jgi:hypothetical protein
LRIVEKEVPALANQVGGFADKVVGVLNNASEQWAIGTNKVIDSTNNDINKMFSAGSIRQQVLSTTRSILSLMA